MGIQTRKAREMEELRQKILDAAEKLFVEEEYATHIPHIKHKNR